MFNIIHTFDIYHIKILKEDVELDKIDHTHVGSCNL